MRAGAGQWEVAIADYRKSADIAPNFAFARANYARPLPKWSNRVSDSQYAEYSSQIPNFADMRAAITAAYWEQEKTGRSGK